MTDADLVQLLRLTTTAFESALHAVLDDDKRAAREVLRASADRRAARSAAQESVLANRWVPMPTKTERLRFVADVGQIGDLVDELARHVVTGGDTRPLCATHRLTVAVLIDAGGRRLRQLADSPVGPGVDPANRGCGGALFEVADQCGHDSSTTAGLCSTMAVVLLEASRHAARAA